MFQDAHAILPSATHDEFAREEFVGSLRKMFTVDLWPGNRAVYEKALLPEFKTRHGREPETAAEAYDLMSESFYYRAGSLVGRSAQELLWDVVGESIERQIDELNARAKPKPNAIGSLRINPDFEMPRYIEAVDIHVMPGNFQTEIRDDDVYAGALYDRGVYVFAFGGLGQQNEGLGMAEALMVKERFPDFKPKRILDIGCGPGFTTVPWKEIFPEAEVYGIDVGAPQVRYAHARAESLGYPIHFSQQDGSKTDFPDGYFDIVTSMLVTHECPAPVIRGLFKESHRLLAKGGMALHDGGYPQPTKPIDIVMNSWFGENANEPFSVGMRRLDFEEELIAAGFHNDAVFRAQREAVYLKGQLPPVSFIGATRE